VEPSVGIREREQNFHKLGLVRQVQKHLKHSDTGGLCHHSMARPPVADGGDDFQIWRVATNVLSKQARTAVKGYCSSLEAGQGANNSSLQEKNKALQNVTRGLGIGRMRWAGHVAPMGEINIYKILVEKYEGKRPLETI
jgi:hypothetical protein